MNSYYSKHHLILNMLRDPVLSFGLIFFYDIPVLQIGASLVIMLVYLILEITYRPLSGKNEQMLSIFDLSVYTLAQVLFIILAFVGDIANTGAKNIFFGYPLIVLLCLLIAFK